MTNTVAELGNKPSRAPEGQGPDPAPAQDLVAANLAQHAVHARGAYASNTERALRSDVAAFTGWCSAAGVVALPAMPDTLVRYVDAMAGHKAPATIRRYLSSIATFHRAARLDNPCAAIEVGLALKRLHREQGRAQTQAAPLIRPLIERLMAAAGPDTKGLRDRALLALAWPCCSDQRAERIGPNPCPGSGDANRVRASQPKHAVQHMNSNVHLRRAALVRVRAQPVTDDLLVARHSRLSSGAQVVS